MLARLLGIAALLLGLGPVAPAQAADPTRIVSARDAKGDVTLTSRPGGLTLSQRRSIDLRVIKIDDVGDKVRFTVRLKRITTSKRFVQMVRIKLPATPSSPLRDGVIGFSPQRPGSAYAWPGKKDTVDEGEACEDLRARVRRKAREVSLTVPDVCVPSDARRIRVRITTGALTDETPTHSWDRLRVPGTHLLR